MSASKDTGACPLRFDIGGMHCAACSSRIERVVGRMEGVDKISVNLATAKAEVWARPGEEKAVSKNLVERVAALGFTASPAAEDNAAAEFAANKARTLADIRTMSQKAGVMVKRSIFAYVNRDTEAAQAVIALDDEVDALFRTIKGELVELIAGNRDEADQAIDLIIIAKYLERIADHAVNIAQWAIFCVTGEILG